MKRLTEVKFAQALKKAIPFWDQCGEDMENGDYVYNVDGEILTKFAFRVDIKDMLKVYEDHLRKELSKHMEVPEHQELSVSLNSYSTRNEGIQSMWLFTCVEQHVPWRLTLDEYRAILADTDKMHDYIMDDSNTYGTRAQMIKYMMKAMGEDEWEPMREYTELEEKQDIHHRDMVEQYKSCF